MANTLQVGDIVRKGNGTTLYRIWAIVNGKAAVVKVSSKTTPTRGCFYPLSLYTIVKEVH